MINLQDLEVKEDTNISEALRELNKDSVNVNTGMSDIDMRTRLTPSQIMSILQIDGLVALNVFPKEFGTYTLTFKRLQISLYSQGRSELVKIAVGRVEEEQKQKRSIFNMLGKKGDI